MMRAKVIGASIVPFAVEPMFGHHYFLLGKERGIRGWHDSGKWSDFGGGFMKADVDAEGCAAREFHEETLGVVACDDAPEVHSISALARRLRNKEYAFRLDVWIRPGVVYVTFVIEIPFQPESRDSFRQRRHQYNIMRTTKDCYLEKTQIQWWSRPQLIQGMRTYSGVIARGVHGRTEKLQGLFKCRGRHILHQFPLQATLLTNAPRHSRVDAGRPPSRFVTGTDGLQAALSRPIARPPRRPS